MEHLHILIADDERGVTDYLAPLLERSGYKVSVAYDGKTALQKVHESHPDLLILDILMPVINGREVCRALRSEGNWTPIIMLTCIADTADKILSLEEGADDYLSKPFEPQELIARIKAVLRRRTNPTEMKGLSSSQRLKAKHLLMDRNQRSLEIKGMKVVVTNKAFQLLEHLMLHPGHVFSRSQLMDAIWGWSQPVASRVVDVRISEIRHILGDDQEEPEYIETVIGVGYRFLATVEIQGNTL